MNAELYLGGIKKQILYYKVIAAQAIDQLSDEQLVYQPNSSSNSVAIIMKHLAGNIFSRWTMMFESDGEKSWRNREDEFTLEEGMLMEDLKEIYGKAWTLVEIELNKLVPEDMDRIIYIRNEGHSLHEALNRQLAHMSYHIGQVLYLGKMMQEDKWKPLSIAKGESDQYNKQMMSGEKVKQHYTDKWTKVEKK